MEITIVDSIDPQNFKPGGTRSYVMCILRSLCDQGIKTSFIGVSYRDMKKPTNKYTFIPIIKNRIPSSYYFLLILLLKTPFLKLSKTSIIHAQREDHLFPFVLFKKKNPKVCTLHGISGKKISLKKGKIVGFIYETLESFTLKRTDKIIAVDESTKKYYIDKHPWLENKIEVIPVGIDLNLFKPMNKEQMKKKYGFDDADKIIIYVGRMEKEKNLEFLLKAFKIISSPEKKYKLLLVGDGKERKQLEKKASDMGMTNVIFKGAVDQQNIPEILNCAEVLALCSLFESGPLVVQEAIACGIPAVTTNVGRVKEFIKDDKIGRIVEYDEYKFSKAIEITVEKSSDHTQYRRKIAEEFSFDRTMNNLLEIYSNFENKH
jgi:glycosyltransferase involved in cell wall biosynthesis